MAPTRAGFRGIGVWGSSVPPDDIHWYIAGPEVGVHGSAATGTGVWGMTQNVGAASDSTIPFGVVGDNRSGSESVTDPHLKRGAGVVGVHGGGPCPLAFGLHAEAAIGRRPSAVEKLPQPHATTVLEDREPQAIGVSVMPTQTRGVH